MSNQMNSIEKKAIAIRPPPDPLFKLRGDMGHIHSLCFPSGDYINTCSLLIASTENGFLHFWNLDTNRISHKQNMGQSIQAVHALNDCLITQEKSGIVKLWSLRESNYQMSNVIESYGGFCKSLVVKSSLIVPQEKSLDIVHLKNMEKTRTLYTEVKPLGSILCMTQAIINNKDYILGAYESGDMFLWSLETTKIVSQTKLDEYTTTITFDSSKGTGIAASVNNFLQIFHIDENSLEITLGNRINIPNQGVNTVKIRKDSRIFVVGCWDNCIRYFNWKNFRCLAVLNEHTKPVTDIQFSPYPVKQWDSNIMAAGSQDGVISLWNLYV